MPAESPISRNTLLVLGAGPAGLACGIAAARSGKHVIILEKNSRPGIKLLLSGAGQCNLTNGQPIETFLNHYGSVKKKRFVQPALFAFSNEYTIRFFEDWGVPLFEREDGKIFPCSLKSNDILQTLVNALKSYGGILRTDVDIHSVLLTNEGFCVETNQGTLTSQRLTIATGGISYPKTGSTGKGCQWAKQMGHTIVPPHSALSPAIVDHYPFAESAGYALENVTIDLYRQGKKIQQGCGNVLFTHRGLSGPGILDLSRFIEPMDVLRLPLCRNVENIESFLTGKKRVKNALSALDIPERVLSAVLSELGISPALPVAEADRTNRRCLKESLSGFPFTVKQLGGWDESMATSGGVLLDEVNRQTMESRIVSGLSFCGEILDVDGDSGGYNIQFALSSGFLAGTRDTGIS